MCLFVNSFSIWTQHLTSQMLKVLKLSYIVLITIPLKLWLIYYNQLLLSISLWIYGLQEATMDILALHALFWIKSINLMRLLLLLLISGIHIPLKILRMLLMTFLKNGICRTKYSQLLLIMEVM